MTTIDYKGLDAVSIQEELKYIREKLDVIADLTLDTKLLEQSHKTHADKVVTVAEQLNSCVKDVEAMKVKVALLEDKQADNRKLLIVVCLVLFGLATGVWLI